MVPLRERHAHRDVVCFCSSNLVCVWSSDGTCARLYLPQTKIRDVIWLQQHELANVWTHPCSTVSVLSNFYSGMFYFLYILRVLFLLLKGGI